MRLLSRRRAVGSAIVSNPGRETTSPTPLPSPGPCATDAPKRSRDVSADGSPTKR